MRRWRLLLTAVLLLSSLLLPLKVLAQANDMVGLSINPAIIEQPLTPGISTTLSIQVTNISNQPLPIVVGTRPLVPLDPLVDDRLRQRYDASQWLTPLESNLLLEPDETVNVQLVARPDDGAGVGGHYALIVFRVITEPTNDETSLAQVNPEVTSLVLFSLPGETVEFAELRPNQPPIWQFSQPNEAIFNLINQGNIHFLPQNQINFKPLFGGGTQVAEPGPHLVLPGTDSQFSTAWPKLEWGLYRMEIKTSYGTPIKSLDISSRLFFVPPPIWIQVVVLVCLVAGFRFIWRFAGKHPVWRRPKKIGSDISKIGKKAGGDELDYLSREPGVRDVSQKPDSRRR